MELTIVADSKLVKKMNAQIMGAFRIAFEDNHIKVIEDMYKDNSHHGMRHTTDLIKNAKKLVIALKKEAEIDWKVLAMSIILHDVYVEDDKKKQETARHGREAVNLFNMYFKDDFTETQRKKIVDAIGTHDDKSKQNVGCRDKLCLEAKILYDVDNLDAFGIKGFYRYVSIYTVKEIPYDKILYNVGNRYKTLNFDISRTMGRKDYEQIRLLCQKYNDNRDTEVSHIIGFIAENHKKTPIHIASDAIQLKSYVPGSWDPRRTFSGFFEELLRIYSKKD